MDYRLLLPQFLLAGLAFALLALDLVLPPARRRYVAYLGVLGLLSILLATVSLRGHEGTLYGGLFVVDSYALFFQGLFLLLGAVILLAAEGYVQKFLGHPGEYYGIVVVAVLAMTVMTSAGELLTAYIALELLSFTFYVLSAYATRDLRSNEAGLKYILLGAFSSALLLYGISLIYGATGTTYFAGIAEAVTGTLSPGLILGLVLLIAGFGFKAAAVPFHMWAPDVYEGAPLPTTAYLSVAAKAAVFGLLLRLFSQGLLPAIEVWRWVIIALAVASITVGNLVAIPQTNIKRMLAYSSIGQAGYLLIGLAALSPQAVSGVLVHLAGYAATNLLAFTAVIAYYNETGHEQIEDFAGAAERAPYLALLLTIAMFSLAGLPFFAGFTTKFYLFTAAAQEGLLWLAALAVAMSVVSLYYYLMVIKQMYIVPSRHSPRLKPSLVLKGVLGMLAVATVGIGVYPGPLVRFIEAASKGLFS